MAKNGNGGTKSPLHSDGQGPGSKNTVGSPSGPKSVSPSDPLGYCKKGK